MSLFRSPRKDAGMRKRIQGALIHHEEVRIGQVLVVLTVYEHIRTALTVSAPYFIELYFVIERS